MTLLDTNVIIYAFEAESPFQRWAQRTIADSVSGNGAGVNVVSVAEICVGEDDPESVTDRIRGWGVQVLDIPSAVAPVCARAFRLYRRRRTAQSGQTLPAMPLPDFFIGAHAQVLKCDLATADAERFRTYFPSVNLLTP